MVKRFLLKNLQLKDINPQVCGIFITESEEVRPRHHIQRHVLHYVTRGKGQYLVNDRAYDLRPGDLFVSHPGYVTCYPSDREDPLTYIWVSFDCATPFAALLDRDVFSAPWSEPIFRQILACCEQPAAEWAVCGQLYDFFARLAALQAPPVPPQEDYVSRAISFIQANYSENIQIADIAADLGLSRNYFCRLFKRRTSLSPQDYLIACRLDTAAKLLVEQGLSQKEAAMQVGYPDVYAFSRMFKRKFGLPPGAYVAQRRKEYGNL